MAVDYLEAAGFKIICRNYAIRGGELDIICLERDTLVFCEVKSRGALSLGTPAESVGKEKRRRVSRAAAAFAQKYRCYDAPMRFDVIEVYLDNGRINHIKDAFLYTE